MKIYDQSTVCTSPGFKPLQDGERGNFLAKVNRKLSCKYLFNHYFFVFSVLIARSYNF